MFLRVLALGLFAAFAFSAPAGAVTAKEKMETCKFGAQDQKLAGKEEKAFIKKYGVKYTYLQAGAPAEMWEKVPQLNHLDTWPATVFIGRDGKVDAVHSGFASPASGEFHTQLQQEFTSRIEKLLAQKVAANPSHTGAL